ncbi:MAG: STAS/SEC14 domain-containing protein [Pseudomonadales bacterium]|nr:STAS/SEC14 domain-containing protein [Pseudomonadales bacterium]
MFDDSDHASNTRFITKQFKYQSPTRQKGSTVEMLTLDLNTSNNVIAIKVNGETSTEEMQQGFSLINKTVNTKLRLYEEIDCFGKTSYEGMLEKMRFLSHADNADFDKIVIVTDTLWLQQAIAAEDKIFCDIDMKAFSYADKEQALLYLAA